MGPNNFNLPTDVAFAPNGDFYVTDGYGNMASMDVLLPEVVQKIILKDLRDRLGDTRFGKPTLLLRIGKRATCAVSMAGAAVGTEQRRWRDAPEVEDEALLYVGLTLPRDVLAARLRARAADMIAQGLKAEVERLLARGYDPSLPAMQGLGYREMALVLRGEIDEAEALRRMQRDTVRYAKRQWTWFARETDIQWLDVGLCGGAEGIAHIVADRVASHAGGGTI